MSRTLPPHFTIRKVQPPHKKNNHLFRNNSPAPQFGICVSANKYNHRHIRLLVVAAIFPLPVSLRLLRLNHLTFTSLPFAELAKCIYDNLYTKRIPSRKCVRPAQTTTKHLFPRTYTCTYAVSIASSGWLTGYVADASRDRREFKSIFTYHLRLDTLDYIADRGADIRVH